jgi:hypothetical protein
MAPIAVSARQRVKQEPLHPASLAILLADSDSCEDSRSTHIAIYEDARRANRKLQSTNRVDFFARWVVGWGMRAAEIAGIALSTTSVAVVYAVMVESGPASLSARFPPCLAYIPCHMARSLHISGDEGVDLSRK